MWIDKINYVLFFLLQSINLWLPGICSYTKQFWLPFFFPSKSSTTSPFDLIHSDSWGADSAPLAQLISHSHWWLFSIYMDFSNFLQMSFYCLHVFSFAEYFVGRTLKCIHTHVSLNFLTFYISNFLSMDVSWAYLHG